MRGESLSRTAPRRVGIRDVALHAGVAISTVSKVLSGRGEVSDALVARVRASADELGYRPNILAQSLRGGATTSVGLVVPDIADTTAGSIVAGVDAILASRGYALLLATSSNGRPEEPSIAFLQGRLVDAIIVASPTDPSMLGSKDGLEAFDGPIVLIEAARPGLHNADVVRPDDGAAAREMVALLQALGHRRIALLSPSATRATNDDDRVGVVANLGVAANGTYAVEVPNEDTVQAAERAIAAELQRDDRPTAVIAWSSASLAGTIKAAGRLSIPIGRDLSVLGWGDGPLARGNEPAISVVVPDPRALGETAAGVALDRLAGRVPETTTSRVRFIDRSSCVVPAHVADNATIAHR